MKKKKSLSTPFFPWEFFEKFNFFFYVTFQFFSSIFSFFCVFFSFLKKTKEKSSIFSTRWWIFGKLDKLRKLWNFEKTFFRFRTFPRVFLFSMFSGIYFEIFRHVSIFFLAFFFFSFFLVCQEKIWKSFIFMDGLDPESMLEVPTSSISTFFDLGFSFESPHSYDSDHLTFEVNV